MLCMAALLYADLLLVCQTHTALLRHRWRWRNKKQDRCVVRMIDAVQWLSKNVHRKGFLQIILGNKNKGGAAGTICSSTDINIQESWKLEEIIQWYYFIYKRNYAGWRQHGFTFDGLRDFLCTQKQGGRSRARTGWFTLTMGPDPVGLSLLQDHIQDRATTLHSH